MDWWNWAVIVLGIVATAWAVIWFVSTRKFPERAASHDVPTGTGGDSRATDTTEGGAKWTDVAERPAGPGAESQRADGRGPLRPGP